MQDSKPLLTSSLVLRASFLVALIGTLGSLFFSEVLGYPPCVLCWYQRIALYPLVPIFFAALWSEDSGYLKYSLPLALIGGGIAVYHNLLYYGLIPNHITPCQQGISCTSRQIEWFGFLTIPLMSLMAFLAVSALGLLSLKLMKPAKERS